MKKFLNLVLLGTLIFSSLFFIFEKPVRAASERDVVINEIAWMGTKASSTDEWIELYNTTQNSIDLTGWKLISLTDNSPNITLSGTISSLGFYLLERTNDDPVKDILADWKGSFGTGGLKNEGEELELRDNLGNVIDKVGCQKDAAGNCKKWFVGKDGPDYITMERINPRASGLEVNNWANNNGEIRNGLDAKGNLINGTPKSQNSVYISKPPLQPICGNNLCESGENSTNCLQDCPTLSVCGNGICESSEENSSNCPSDCPTQPLPEQPLPQPVCGNSICEAGEDLNSCPKDCPPSLNIVINEFVADPIDGEEEWVELYNNTDKEIDLIGWQIEEGSGASTTISGIISGKGFFVVEKIKGYLNNTGDIIILRDPNGKIIDQVVYGSWDDGDKTDNAPATRDPNSISRVIDGYDTDQDYLDFKISTAPTKGESNKISSNEKTYPFGVIINELLPNPKGDDSEFEFIELKNLTETEVDLEGWKLEDAAGIKFIISSKNLSLTKIPAKGFFVLWRKNSKIALNNSGSEILKLYQPNDNLVDFVQYSGSVQEDYAYSRDEKNNWVWSIQTTPGQENIIKKANQKPKAVISAKNKALISEEVIFDASDSYDPDGDNLIYVWHFGDGSNSTNVLVKHIYKKAGKYNVKLEVKDIFGATDTAKLTIEILAGEKIISFSPLETEILITEFLPNPKGNDEQEWIEIFNAGQEEINLDNWFLDDIDGGSKPYKIREKIILPGEYLVFYRQETKIALNNNFDSGRILDPEGNLFFEIAYEKPKEGYSYAIDENGDWHWTSILTPGKKNLFSQEEIITKKSQTKIAAEKGKILEIPLTEIRNQDIGDLIKVQGIVSVEPGILGVQIFYLAGSGVQIYSYKKDFPSLKIGDKIEVLGELAEYKGEARIKVATKDEIKILKSEPPPEPKKVKTGEIDEDLEGSLVLVQGEMIESKANTFYLDDGSGEVKIYLKKTAGLKKPKMKEGNWLKVIGIVSQYNQEYRLLPRYQSDLELISKKENKDDFQIAGSLQEQKIPLSEKIRSFDLFSPANYREKIKYLGLSAITLMAIFFGLLWKRKKLLK